MASKNPLSPLKLGKPKTNEEKETILHCPKCNSTRITGYSYFNGTGFTCKKCGYGWPVGTAPLMSEEQKREFLSDCRRRMQEEVYTYTEGCILPLTEYDRIEDTIQNNEEFFRKRMYGE